MSENINVRAIKTGQKSSIWQAFLTCFLFRSECK